MSFLYAQGRESYMMYVLKVAKNLAFQEESFFFPQSSFIWTFLVPDNM